MKIPNSVLEEIRSRAKDAWPEDMEMREVFVNEEIDGYKDYQSIDFSDLTEKQKEEIIEVAREYSVNWDEIAWNVENEVGAIIALKQYKPSSVSSELLTQWKIEADEESAVYFRLQLNYVKNKVRQYESIEKTRVEIDPIKKLLIELEYIVGNECYNGNIQNYESWESWESWESFRAKAVPFAIRLSSLMGKDKIRDGTSPKRCRAKS